MRQHSENTSQTWTRKVSCSVNKTVFGYQICGHRSGPTLVVAAHRTMVKAIHDRLAAIPTLPWMNGRINIVAVDSVDGVFDPTRSRGFGPQSADDILFIPFADRSATAIDQAYWTVLRACASCGMISGRGVRN